MSYYYYPHLFDSGGYLSQRGDADDDDLLLSNATDHDFKFPMELDELTVEYRIDENLRGNLPQVLANALEEELVDIEDEEAQERAEQHAGILKKIGSTDGLFCSQGILEPFVGFITEEEAAALIDFLGNFTFQDDLMEELKGKMLALLNVAKSNHKGLIYVLL